MNTSLGERGFLVEIPLPTQVAKAAELASLKTIFLTAQIEGGLSTLHDALDRLTHIGNVYGSFAGDLSSGLISSLSVITPRDQLRVAVDDQVCVVADEHDLPLLFGLPELLNDFLHNRIVEVLFGLIVGLYLIPRIWI